MKTIFKNKFFLRLDLPPVIFQSQQKFISSHQLLEIEI